MTSHHQGGRHTAFLPHDQLQRGIQRGIPAAGPAGRTGPLRYACNAGWRGWPMGGVRHSDW